MDLSLSIDQVAFEIGPVIFMSGVITFRRRRLKSRRVMIKL